MIGYMSTRSRTSRLAMHISPRMTASARTALAWLRSGRVCSVLAGLLMLSTAALAVVGHVSPLRISDSPLAADLFPDGPLRLWSLLTAWAGATHLGPLTGVVTLLTVGIALERFIGARRLLLSAFLPHAVGVGIALVAHPLISAVAPTWGHLTTRYQISGVPLLLLGPLLASTVLMNHTWSRRTRLATLVFLLVETAVTGTPASLARLATAVAGLLLGAVAWRRSASSIRMSRTRRSSRNLLALLVACWSLTLTLATVTRSDLGPLASARYGVVPEGGAPHLATGALILSLMPLLLQLALADGLRRGRRIAALGTIGLQIFLALCSILSINTLRIDESFVPEGGAPVIISGSESVWDSLHHIAVPVMLNLGLVLLVVWNRDHLRLHTRAGVVRKAVGTWAVAALVCAVASVGLGSLVVQDFVPDATPVALLVDFLLRLLPTAAEGLLIPPLTPVGPLASLAAWFFPILAWTAAVACTWAAMTNPAITPRVNHEDLIALVRARGAGTLGWMLTWPGNEAWIAEDRRTGFAYRAGSGVALTLGDPAAAGPEDTRAAVEGFTTFASEAGLVPALYSVHEPTMLAARDQGWTVLQVAEEAVIDLPDLAFRGKAFQDVRTALNHSRREGITAEWTTWRTAPEGRRDQIRAISQGWVGEKALPEMGFTLGGLREIDDDDTRLLLAVDESGTVHAVTSWMPVHRGGKVVGLTLDVMRRREGGWRPAIEFLIARAAQDAQAEGLEVLSLSGAPLARSGTSGDLTGDGTDDVGASRFDPLLDLLASLLEPAYGFRSLHAFKRKFQPRKVPMYLAVPDVVDLAAVGVAIGRAYVPDLTPAQTARFAQVLVTHD